ncbi:MAG: DUF2283 domain-containing protein [Candidatus Peribacteraceae bacterium]|nr:DUF2283 domain-containing protein [Candidatus Peribacteraceae bacterium]
MSPAKDIRINWDRESDTMYVLHAAANPDRTKNLTLSAEVVGRFDENHRVVGFIIEDFTRLFPEMKEAQEYLLMEMFDGLLQVLNKPSAINFTQQVASAI